MAESEEQFVPAEARNFRTTHWSVVLAARDEGFGARNTALETLCRTYWYPLYAYVRRKGHDAHDAQDLTQGFFERFLSKNYLQSVAADRGKFRSFLLASLNHFLANEWDKSQTQKRGGGHEIISLDAEMAEERYDREPGHELSPEKIFERRWANTVLEIVLKRLRAEFDVAGQVKRFDALKGFILDERGATPFAEVARQLNMNEAAVKSAVHRMRKRFRELFREEIANTVASPAEIEEEIRHLILALK
jgi:RNA polymerase sigma-70 factor (ECF subfamily)